MDPSLLTILLFGSLVALLLLGLPIAFTLGGLAILFTLWLWGPAGLLMVASHAYGVGMDFILVSVPLFVLMAVVLEGSGIAEELFETMYRWFGGLPGGLLTGTVIICAIFAAMSGISGVATVTMGLIALPAMLKRGYDRQMAIGGIMCGGALGIIIPPSVIAILYGSITGTSVGKLFIGGLVPGLIIALVMIIYTTIRCLINPEKGPPVPLEERAGWKEKFISLKNIILPFLLIILVLGVIYSGICTPTEASGIGALGALVSSLIHRRLTWKKLKMAVLRTLGVTCMAMWIVIGAKCFSSIYTAGGASDFILSLVKDLQVPPLLMIGIMQFIFFILGMFIDPVGMCMICSPVFLPIVTTLGFDPTWFGILFILNCGMAYITPPFGFNLFYMRAIVPEDCSMGEIYNSVWPWVICQAIVLILVLLFPEIGMWLPNRMK
ncbi:MAG: TRAP transporter large permease [Thermodesulfobacteriota bacterium]